MALNLCFPDDMQGNGTFVSAGSVRKGRSVSLLQRLAG